MKRENNPTDNLQKYCSFYRLIDNSELYDLVDNHLEQRAGLLKDAGDISEDFSTSPEPLRKALELFTPSGCPYVRCKNESTDKLLFGHRKKEGLES